MSEQEYMDSVYKKNKEIFEAETIRISSTSLRSIIQHSFREGVKEGRAKTSNAGDALFDKIFGKDRL